MPLSRNPSTGIEFFLSADSRMRLRDSAGHFARFDAEAELYTQKQLLEMARELQVAVRREFAPHDRMPTTFDGQPAVGRVRTIDTLRVTSGPMWVNLSIGGGAPYVQVGTPPHVIAVRGAASAVAFPGAGVTQTGFPVQTAKALHWTVGGRDFFAKEVHSPGYKGDKFLDRAIDDVDLERQLSQIASNTFARVTGYKADFVRTA